MAELPIAPIGRIIKNAGAQRISEDAKDILRDYLEKEGQRVASESITMAKHAGRKSIKGDDIKLVIKNYGNGNINIQGIQAGFNNMQKFEGNIYSFNELYKMIEGNDENVNETKENLTVIEQELRKDKINLSKIKNSVNWLKTNANWTIPSIIAIIMPLMGLN